RGREVSVPNAAQERQGKRDCMMDFTQDERNMMMLYSPGTRSGMCEALTLMKEQLSEDESELFALEDEVLSKVSAMEDAAFEKLNLDPD
uniref:transposon-transfer assisting family protein n=1 Tax=Clostridioides difficile TaxID=1496 RepID=UPI001F1A80BA